MSRLRRLMVALALLVAACGGFAGWLAHVGYFGGPVFFEIPAKRGTSAHGAVAVLLSGDLGFRIGMGPRIADRLAADGIPVVGVSSLAYFRTQRTPADAQALLAEAARRALAFGHGDRLILIGQSFGADMLHVGLTRLPADLRGKVQMVGLVVPTDTLFFRASPGEMFNWARPDAAALPTARALTWVPTVCIRGVEEADSLCPALTQPNVRDIALPGGHALHHDADALYAALRGQILATSPRAV